LNNKNIIPIHELATKIPVIKKMGKIVQCHGVFDLLHVGHIKYLQEAKHFGDVLIVTITPDRFINKGPGRPAFTSDLRAEVLSALEIVDYVAINEWPTAVEAINLLKPDYYVKGPDYRDNELDITGAIKLETEAVESVGGQIQYTDDITFSSSTLINQHFSKLDPRQQTYLEMLKKKYSVEDIFSMIDSLSNIDVLLVGETIIDEYIFCDTIGKSGKEPILVTQRLYSEKYAGGIIAIANHLSEFCQSIKVLTYFGDRDSHQQFIMEHISENVTVDPIIKSKSPTILKTRFVDNYTRAKTLGVYDINDELLNYKEELLLLEKLNQNQLDSGLVLVTDYGHGLVTPNVVKVLEKNSKYLAVNTQLNAFNVGYHTISKYGSAKYICIHEGELRHDYRNRTDSVEDLITELQNKINTDKIVITRGNKGSMVFSDGDFTSCPAYTTDIVDRVGAGDALLSITALCFYAGLPPEITLFIGNLAAAQKIASIGNKQKLNKVSLMKSIESLLK